MPTARGMEQPSNDAYVVLCVQHSPKAEVQWKVIHTFYKWILIHRESMDSLPPSHPVAEVKDKSAL
jgi:hypothetical protein